MEEIENINIREEYYNDVYDLNPKWWMRWGILSVILVLLIILIMGSLIQYPDIISAECRLTTNDPSITIPLVNNTQIERIFIDNNKSVKSNTPILLLKNNNNYDDIIFLENELSNFSFERDSMISFFNRFIKNDLLLSGDIEINWNSLFNELLAYYKIEELGSYQSQISFVDSELTKQYNLRKYYQNLIQKDQKQRILYEEKVKVDSFLYAKGIISKMEYNAKKREHNSQIQALEANIQALKRINVDITKLNNTKQNHSNNETGFLLEKQLAIRKSVNKLKSAIGFWKKQYVITSPIEGKVTYIQNVKEGAYYQGDILVVTPEYKEYYALIQIPFIGAGKVAEKQKVIIKLNDYPYREYGLITGTLNEFSPVAGKQYYLGKVTISKDNVSSYGKKIKMKENMTGIGEIVTNERSILGRLFEKLIYAFNR